MRLESTLIIVEIQDEEGHWRQRGIPYESLATAEVAQLRQEERGVEARVSHKLIYSDIRNPYKV